MKTPRIWPMMVLLAFVTLGVTKAQAIIIICTPPFGITAGQTARITVANSGTKAIIINDRVLDSNGVVLTRLARQSLEPGKMVSLDLNADNILRGAQRIQIRADITSDSRDIVTSVEIFENATGKTIVALGGPDT